MCANWMAGSDINLSLGIHLYQVYPKALSCYLLVDVLRISLTHFIILS